MITYVIKHPSGLILLETYNDYEPPCKIAYEKKNKTTWVNLEALGYSCVRIEVKELPKPIHFKNKK